MVHFFIGWFLLKIEFDLKAKKILERGEADVPLFKTNAATWPKIEFSTVI